MWVGCVLLLLIGVLSVGYTPYAWQQGDAMLSATVCSATSDATGNGSGIGAGSTSPDSRGCFVEVAGRVSARYGRNQWVFTPDARTRRVGYVKFCLVLDIAVTRHGRQRPSSGAASWSPRSLCRGDG